MKKKLGVVSCSLFLAAGVLCVAAVLPMESGLFVNRSKAVSGFYVELTSDDKYEGGNQKEILTGEGNKVNFAYTNASTSANGHAVLSDGGTIKNVDQITGLYLINTNFSLGNGVSFMFRASYDGVSWGDYAFIKDTEGENNAYYLPYMNYIEFKAVGGSVDINLLSFDFSCDSYDTDTSLSYKCGTTFVDSNIDNYEAGNSFNSYLDGLTVYSLYSDGSKEVLDESYYNLILKNSSGTEVSKDAALSTGTYTVVISRGDYQFVDVSYNFTVGAAFRITTNLNETKEIHTDAQKTYLSYTGDYATIDPNKYPDGSKNDSYSNGVPLAWEFTPTKGKTIKNYSVTYGQYEDLSDSYELVGTSNSSITLTNVYLGTNYFQINANYTDGSKESSTIKIFEVDGTAPRNLSVGNMTNCRDMGGRETIFGGKVKQGLLFRTCGKNYDNKGMTLNDTAKDIMLNQLGLKTEINVSNNDNNLIGLNGTTSYGAYMDYASQSGVSKHHFSRNTESVKNVFKILSDENNYPLYYHCRIGTDRTGLVGNLVYGLLGVPLNMIYQDYLFSNFGQIGEKRYIGSQAGQDDISIYMQEINAMPGANFQEKTYNTLLSIGVPRETLDTVIDLLTVGNKPNNEQGQLVANANELDLSGTSATYTARSNITDRKEPLYYAKMSNGATASYTFTTTSSGTAKIYGYLGHNDYSSSKNVSSSLGLSVDGANVSIPSTSFQTAGMGNISNRTNYYFVYLGEKTLSAGNHTVTLSGKANDMKLGALSVFGVDAKLPEIYPEAITLDSSSVSLEIGETKKLNVTYTPGNCNLGKGVTYSSADDNIATVSSTGLITGVGAGEVQITVTSTYNPSITATCSVTVTVPPLHAYNEHNWGSGTKYSTSGVTVTKYTCACGANKVQFAALDGTFASGSKNKDDGTVPSGFMKLNSNGNSISYTFTLPGAISGELYFDCIMDSFKSGGNMDKTYSSYQKNKVDYNFTINVNGTKLTTTNTSTYKEMLGSSSDPNRSGYSYQGLCYYGGISFNSGSNTLTFTRNESYNPLIANFVIIY